jgi:hypothetical protein
VVHRRQANALGLDNARLRRAVRGGDLVRRFPDVLVRAGVAGTATDDWAAFLGGGRAAVLSGASAGRAHGLAWPGAAVVVVPNERHVPLRGVRVLREPIDAEHVVRLPDGRRAATLDRAVFDAVRLAAAEDREALLDRALLQSHTCVDAFGRLVETFTGRPGAPALRALHTGVTSGARSRAERLAVPLLLRCDSGWLFNHPVALPDGGKAVLDAALTEVRLAVEIDGRAHHVDAERFQSDRARQNALVGLGWTVLRFTWADLTQRPDAVTASVRATITRLRAAMPDEPSHRAV